MSEEFLIMCFLNICHVSLIYIGRSWCLDSCPASYMQRDCKGRVKNLLEHGVVIPPIWLHRHKTDYNFFQQWPRPKWEAYTKSVFKIHHSSSPFITDVYSIF